MRWGVVAFGKRMEPRIDGNQSPIPFTHFLVSNSGNVNQR
jgi:hypothetical protein